MFTKISKSDIYNQSSLLKNNANKFLDLLLIDTFYIFMLFWCTSFWWNVAVIMLSIKVFFMSIKECFLLHIYQILIYRSTFTFERQMFFLCVCVCVCACLRACARVRACVCVCVEGGGYFFLIFGWCWGDSSFSILFYSVLFLTDPTNSCLILIKFLDFVEYKL
jgi:hypothetical protein